jgi:glycerol uptake facilitator-like aquaporin
MRLVERLMHSESIRRSLLAEGLGSLLLAATVVGSGIMAERLAGGNLAVALIANTGATVAVLATLIALLGPLSGAHFNPAVSVIEALHGKLAWPDAGAYTLVQIAGCCGGALLAHAMFESPLWQMSAHVRTGPAQWLAEFVATFGLDGGVGTPTIRRCAVDDCGLDRRGLLVHGLHIICESSDHHRPGVDQYLFRHSPE